MIKFIKGDLIQMAKDGEFDIIIHGANCFHTMGAGIAKSIREKFPQAYLADKDTKYADAKKVGTYSYGMVKTNKKILNMDSQYAYKYVLVINAYTQYKISNGINDVFSYDGFEKILRDIDEKYPYYKIGLPLIGCGLANGNKERILKIIEDVLGHRDVIVVEYQK